MCSTVEDMQYFEGCAVLRRHIISMDMVCSTDLSHHQNRGGTPSMRTWVCSHIINMDESLLFWTTKTDRGGGGGGGGLMVAFI